MKRTQLFVLSASLLAFSGLAYADGCNGGTTNCELPGTPASGNPSLVAPTILGGTITASQLKALNVDNSATATPNHNGTLYWFFAYATSLPAPSTTSGSADFANGSTNALQVRAQNAVADNAATTLTTDHLVNGKILGLKPAQTYDVYVQACRPGLASNNDANPKNCSNWVKAFSNIQMAPLPTNVFITPVPADMSQINTLNINVDGTKVDINDPTDASIVVRNVDAGNIDTTLSLSYTNPMPLGASSTPSFNFVPNTQYRYLGQLDYPPPPNFTAQENKGPFYSTPSDPGNLTHDQATHFTVTIHFTNTATGVIANPKNTKYHIVVTGPGTLPGPFDLFSQTGNPGVSGTASEDITTGGFKINSLAANTPYTVTVTAMNNGAGWKNSNPVSTSFTTLPLTPAYTVSNVTDTSADFKVDLTGSVGQETGITQYQIKRCPVAPNSGACTTLPASPANWPAAHFVTFNDSGLTPNTPYSYQVVFYESPTDFSAPMPTDFLGSNNTLFNTQPEAPQGPMTFTTIGYSSFTAHFNDPSANASWTRYQLTCSPSCGTIVQLKASGSAQGIAVTGLTPETPYTVTALTLNELKRLGTTCSAAGNCMDSGTLSGSQTTNNQPPSVNTPQVTVHVTSATLSVTASDNGGPTHLTFLWTLNPAAGAALTSATGNTSINGANATNVTQLTFAVNGTYSGNVTVTDHDGTGPGIPVTVSWTTSQAASIPTKIGISPSTSTVITGNDQVFNAIVCDQFETGTCDINSAHKISGQTVNWIVSGGGTPLTQNGTTSYTFHATTPGGPFTLTASFPGATSGTAAITVLAAGPVVNSFGFAMSAGNKGGTLTIVGHDNVAHSINSSFSGSDSGITFSPSSVASADNVAGTTAVIFPKAGTFTLTDNLGSGISTFTVVTVPQVLSGSLAGIKVCANGDSSCSGSITLKTLQTQQFTATGMDQFGNPMTLTSIQWSNNVSASGASASFSSASIGQNVRIAATGMDQFGNSKSNFLTVNLVSFDVSSAIAYPVPYKASSGTGMIHFKGLGSQSSIHIYTTSGRRVFDYSSTSDSFDWNVKNSSSENLASGVYFYVIESPEGKKHGKLIIIQ